MAKNGRQKGAAAEREFAHVLKSYGAEARRGVQYSGSLGSPDVVCDSMPTIHFEVKRVEKFYLYKSLEQAIGDSAGQKMPVVVHRQNNQPWVAVLRIEDFMQLCKEAGRLESDIEELDLIL